MKKIDVFKSGIKIGLYKKIKWIISLFCIIEAKSTDTNLGPFSIIIQDNKYCTIDDTGSIVPITDAPTVGLPLFRIVDKITVDKSIVENIPEGKPINTTLGTVLKNCILLVDPFKNKIPFMEHNFSMSDVQKAILPKFKDDDKENGNLDPNAIYVSEYLKCGKNSGFIAGLALICVPTSTRKSIVQPPWVVGLRNELLKQYEGQLNDPAVIAKIEKVLVDKYIDYIKDDDAKHFLLNTKKSIGNNKKKLFLSLGGETGLDGNNTNVHYIPKSLSEGWDVKEYKYMIDGMRLGSFSRGAETELGGVSFKYLTRSSQNMNVTIDDCGTSLGRNLEVTNNTMKRLIGFKVIEGKNQTKVNTIEEASKYLGKVISVRSPMYCKEGKTDFCRACVGDTLALNPKGLSTAVAGYGSTMLAIKMSKMHSQALASELAFLPDILL